MRPPFWKMAAPREKTDGTPAGSVLSDNNFEVFRRVVVDFEGINLRRKFLNGLESDNIHVMIGSMTIDCLGILSDLSDCEEKLFPVGYQCSRVYWSTTDARKRCVYTCKILECRPPPSGKDINSTVHHEKNRTIAHSPPREEMHEPSTQKVKPLDKVGLPSPELLSSASSTWTSSRHSGVGRIRTHRYSSNQRFPGPRPLPSAGSPITHEIVTVGDPVLSSGLRSIGSRRHSASSISPQPSKPRVISPSRSETTRLAASSPDTTAALAEHKSAGVESGGIPSSLLNPSSCVPSNGHRNPRTKDGSKTQEGSSYKRRYPRRSARARSNMFFGLTPLYGVRSYGEEDLPFCSSTPGKKRGKRSAEGQVDGADDLSSSEEDDVYYYNFSRTVVSAADDRLGVRNLFKDDERNLHRIPNWME
ncbi:unnamed protein product [Ranitomeya imitator]|uniref:Uncharacterized protein n=1 Tax=Ranitomeya imitator TaxID=111125 RepID=A0ABN9L0S1_9NEOB|nr:unnamed protein product [Ranitomeya imitator]